MAVAVQTSSKVTWSSGDGTLNKPTGTVDGDLILIFVGGDLGSSESHTYSVSGFATLCALTRSHASNAGTDLIVFWKIASSEPASWTVDIDSDNLSQAVALRIDGHDPADPFDITGITGYDNSTEAKIPSVVTTVANTLVIGGVTWDASKTLTAVPTDWTAVEHADTSGADLHVIKRAYAGTGATGVAQYDLSSASPHVGAAIAVQPATGGTSVTVTPSAQSKTLNLLAPTVSATRNPTATPSVLSKTIAVQAPTVSTTRSVTVTPAAVSSQASVLAPTVSTVRNVTVLPDALGSSFTVQAPSLSIGETLQPSSISSVFSIPSPTITTTRSVTVLPSVVTGAINLLSPAYAGPESINITVTPQPIEIGRRTYVYDDDYNRYKRIFGDIYIQE